MEEQRKGLKQSLVTDSHSSCYCSGKLNGLHAHCCHRQAKETCLPITHRCCLSSHPSPWNQAIPHPTPQGLLGTEMLIQLSLSDLFNSNLV